MKTTIQAIDFKPRKSLTDFVKEAIGKLDAINDQITRSRVTLKVVQSSKKENKLCEIKLITPGHEFFASKENETFEAAIANTVDAIRHQMKKRTNSRIQEVRDFAFSAEP